jgi:hypothetical protein
MSQSQLTNFDQKLLDTAQIRVQPAQGVSYIINLQFPPKVVSENNSMIWADKANTYSTGPVVWQKGATARKLEVEWEYIATDNVFTPDFIALQLRHLKSYHFEFKLPGSFLPVVVFKYTEILPDNIKFIMKNIAISYGPEMVAFNGKYHPLYTKAAISIQMVTQLGSIDGKEPPRQAFSENLSPGPKPEWY